MLKGAVLLGKRSVPKKETKTKSNTTKIEKREKSMPVLGLALAKVLESNFLASGRLVLVVSYRSKSEHFL